MASGINLEDFTLKLVDPSFFQEYFRINIKLYDPDGFFGMKGYDYLVYGEKEKINEHGSVCLSVLLHTMKSVENMRDEKFHKLTEFLDTKGIDIDEIIDGKVLIAVGPANRSSIGYNSCSFFFKPHKKGKKPGGENEQDSELVRKRRRREASPQREEETRAQESESV